MDLYAVARADSAQHGQTAWQPPRARPPHHAPITHCTTARLDWVQHDCDGAQQGPCQEDGLPEGAEGKDMGGSVQVQLQPSARAVLPGSLQQQCTWVGVRLLATQLAGAPIHGGAQAQLSGLPWGLATEDHHPRTVILLPALYDALWTAKTCGYRPESMLRAPVAPAPEAAASFPSLLSFPRVNPRVSSRTFEVLRRPLASAILAIRPVQVPGRERAVEGGYGRQRAASWDAEASMTRQPADKRARSNPEAGWPG